MITFPVTVNGIEVTARFSEQEADGLFLPFLQKLTELQARKRRRVLVMLAAPPGAGKTTLLSFLEHLSRSREGLAPVQAVGMDGFHRQQEYLLTHTIVRDGQDVRMVDVKGAPATFDLDRLTERVRRVASGEACGWPVYDRLLHNPVEDALLITGDVVLLEGNYLLLDEDGWRDLRAFADYTVSVRADEAFLRERLIERRIRTGVDRDASVRFVDFSDMPNVRLCLEKTLPADLRLLLDGSGRYSVLP